jgi:hypothetical protein
MTAYWAMRKIGLRVFGAAMACPVIKAVSLIVSPSSFASHLTLSKLVSDLGAARHATASRCMQTAIAGWQG